MKRHALTILTAVALATLGASILPAVAASDSKTQSGIACKPRIHTQPYYFEAGAIWNLSGIQQEYLCPILRDVMSGDSDGVDDFLMWVYDRHPTANVSCTFYSIRSNGTVRASSNRVTAGHSSSPLPLDFPSWSAFVKMPWEVLAAIDFFTVEGAPWHGLVTHYVLVVMQLSTRRVAIAGITPHPHAAFRQQCARQLTDPFDGFLLGKRYTLHDRDSKFTDAFDTTLRNSGVEPVVLPPRSPNSNTHCERFVRSLKEEALKRMIVMGEASLWHVLREYLAHYPAERNHQGLANELIEHKPEIEEHTGHVRRRERLGGPLSDYYREAA